MHCEAASPGLWVRMRGQQSQGRWVPQMNRLVRIGWTSLVELLCMSTMSLEKVEEGNRVVELEYTKLHCDCS